MSVEVLTAGREAVFDSELLTEDGFALIGFEDFEVETVDLDVDVDVDTDLEVEVDLEVVVVLEVVDGVDLDGVEALPPLRVCAKASDWNAVSANPSSATAIVVLSVFMIKKFWD